MIESKSVRKRSVGRPKTNKALQKLRVQTWFNAVAEASGKTAYELEKEFAPSTVDRENFNKQRARLWEKYRLGKTMPTIKEKKGGKKGVAQLVEEKYPGTLKVLQDPIWTIADATAFVTMNDLKQIYISLEHPIKALFVEDGDLTNRLFWKKPCDDVESILQVLSDLESMSALTGLLCLLRETLLCQHESNYKKTVCTLKEISTSKVQSITINRLSKITLKQFQ
jgi:hypothetical protein